MRNRESLHARLSAALAATGSIGLWIFLLVHLMNNYASPTLN